MLGIYFFLYQLDLKTGDAAKILVSAEVPIRFSNVVFRVLTEDIFGLLCLVSDDVQCRLYQYKIL